jgi:hypothetical protein
MAVVAEAFTFGVGDAQTTARIYPSSAPARAVLVLAHGAGAPQTHPWMVRMAEALASRAIDVVTFNFLYAEARRRVPDKNDVLEATWRAAIAAVRLRGDLGRAPDDAAAHLFIGGKSMGGRIATQVAAAAASGATDDVGPIAGLVLLGYPLHPPGRPDKLRAAHLPRVEAPMLFVQGSRDTFGSPAELEPFVAPLAPRGTRVFPIDGGDHSLVLPKSKRLDAAAITALVADEIARFIGATP